MKSGPYPLLDLGGLDRALAAGVADLQAFKSALTDAHEVLQRRYRANHDIVELVGSRARFIDQILRRAWVLHLKDIPGAALVAVGGYGRGELHPHSDIDLLILLAKQEDDALREGLESLLTFFWDIGLEVGHSVRTIDECVHEAKADITVMTNILEARYLAGERPLLDRMLKATGPEHIWPSDQFFAAKAEEQRIRHTKYGDTAYNLEPNIKENPGGMRDIQMIGWVAKRHFGGRTLHDLVNYGFLTETEYETLVAGQALLWRIRFGLHQLAGRREDRLLFDHQQALAEQFGYSGDGANLAVEHFMQRYYRTVQELNRLNEMLLQLFDEAILGSPIDEPPQPISARFQARNGFIEVTHDKVFEQSPTALLEIFLQMQRHAELRGVRATTVRLLRDHRHLIDRAFRDSKEARWLFMEIFRQPRGLTHELHRMNRYGVLAAYLPEFKNIVGRMQYDLFHQFTVDEHTLLVVRFLRQFAVPEHRHEFPLCSEIMDTLPKRELIYLAALFHDIAKGRGGDHSQLGADDAWRFCRSHGLSNYDSGLVSWLVRKHLVMSMTAQRKDIEDPEIIQAFASEVVDPLRLDYLYLLTVADSRATNPKRWNEYMNSLLRQLYTATRRAFARGLHNPQEQDELIQQKQGDALASLKAAGYTTEDIHALWMHLSVDYFLHSSPAEIFWQTRTVLDADPADRPLVKVRSRRDRGGTEIFICVDDTDNVFANSAGVLDQLGLNIVNARIQSAGSGCTMNSFMVLEDDGSPVEDSDRIQEIVRRLRHELSKPDLLEQTISRHVPRQLKHFKCDSRVWVDQDDHNHRTVLRLQASDRPGLLADIGRVFADQHIRVLNAKISTIGAQAEDTFFITDEEDRQIDDPERLQRLEDALCARVDEEE